MPVSGFLHPCPATKMKSPSMIACEYGPLGCGACSVTMAFLTGPSAIVLGVLGCACWSREVIEDTEQIAIRIGRGELVQAPRLRLRCGDQLRLARAPQSVQLINLLLAFKIQPGQHRPNVAVLLAIVRVCQEHPAVALRDSGQSKVVATPIDCESEIAFVVNRRLCDISHRYLRNGAAKSRFHGHSCLEINEGATAPGTADKPDSVSRFVGGWVSTGRSPDRARTPQWSRTAGWRRAATAPSDPG